MAISNEQKDAAAQGHDPFGGRVIAQLHRQAVYRRDQGATGHEATACSAVYMNPYNFRVPIVFGVLNGPLLNASSFAAITDSDLEAAVATEWPNLVAAAYPAGEA